MTDPARPAVPLAPVSSSHSQVVRRLATLAVGDPEAFHEMALRTRSPDVLDAVAHLAVTGSRARALLEIGRAVDAGLEPGLLDALTPQVRWLSELAALSAIQVTPVTPDLLAARGLWQWVAQLDESQLTQRHRDIRAQVAWTLRDRPGEVGRAEVASWLQDDLLSLPVRQELRADLANPWLADPSMAAPVAWQEACREILGPRLAPLDVPAGTGSPYDRLTAPSAVGGVGDRSVAVILTAYRPDHQLLTAVRSMIAQTWQEWTLLLVDDASGPEYAELLAEAESLDPRIRVLRMTENGGTYVARNTALREIGAADFVTFHDSDDWSHPQRLELTLEPLLADPHIVATTAWALKATDSLELTRLGYRGVSRIAASLVVRRDPVCNTLGSFDPVRKSADKEFQLRIEAAFPGRTAQVREPTSLIRRGHDSLSSSDHSRGWRHHSRRHYQQAYQPWHRRIKRGETTAHLDDSGERLFWAPNRWLPRAPAAGRYDVVIAADFSRPDTHERVDALIGRARRHGRRVGLLQVDGPVLLTTPEPPTSSTVVRRVRRGQCDWVYLDDRLEVVQVVVPDVSVLHPGSEQVAAWSTSQVDLDLPAEDLAVDPRVVERRAESTFGAPAHWWDASQVSWPTVRSAADGAEREGPDGDREVGAQTVQDLRE